MKYLVFGLILAFFAQSCSSSSETKVTLRRGTWRASLEFQEKQLPFNFIVSNDKSGGSDITILNAGERLLLDEVEIKDDSINIPLHIFDASLKGVLRNDSIIGSFVKNYDPNNIIPFTAVFGQAFRFPKPNSNKVSANYTGTYKVKFTNDKDTTDAIGVFQQKADSVTGTFLTTTGDYRYLQGNVVNDTLMLSAFDGNHAYLFNAVFVNEKELKGVFYSGRTKKSSWTGVADPDAKLPDADTLTKLAKGYEKVEFTFPDVDNKPVSLSDEKYKNKVIILQLFGTWCPNCMDETRFLAPWYEKNASRGVEIIALAFERKDDFAYASERVKKMDQKMNVPYDMLIAGVNDKELASTKLPMLEKIYSFPTTIFIGKDGKVKKIHTGFSGPGTGKYYEEFIEDFNTTVNALLNEKPVSGASL